MNFNFNFNLQDDEFVKNVHNALNDAYVKFKGIFCADYNGCLNVRVFSTREEYKQWTGYGDRYRNWMVGRCDADENEIGLIAPVNAERTIEEMLLIAKHELTHYLVEKCFGERESIVLDEGITWFIEGQMPTKIIESSDIVTSE